MLKQDDALEFMKVTMKEASNHKSRGHWAVITKLNKLPNVKTILASWAFKRKHYQDGRINKWKSQLCGNEGMQTY